MKVYIHTLDDAPAFFSKQDGQICFHAGNREKIKPARNLEQIRREQATTKKNREAWGFRFEPRRYGYTIYNVSRA